MVTTTKSRRPRPAPAVQVQSEPRARSGVRLGSRVPLDPLADPGLSDCAKVILAAICELSRGEADLPFNIPTLEALAALTGRNKSQVLGACLELLRREWCWMLDTSRPDQVERLRRIGLEPSWEAERDGIASPRHLILLWRLDGRPSSRAAATETGRDGGQS